MEKYPNCPIDGKPMEIIDSRTWRLILVTGIVLDMRLYIGAYIVSMLKKKLMHFDASKNR